MSLPSMREREGERKEVGGGMTDITKVSNILSFIIVTAIKEWRSPSERWKSQIKEPLTWLFCQHKRFSF